MSFCKKTTKPEEMRKKHELENKKKKPKRPTSTTYSPNPANYTLFCTMKPSTSASKSSFNKTTRFKTQPVGSGLGPAKYSVMQEWLGKENPKQ